MQDIKKGSFKRTEGATRFGPAIKQKPSDVPENMPPRINKTPLMNRKEEAAFSSLYTQKQSHPSSQNSFITLLGRFSFVAVSLFVLFFVLFTFVFDRAKVSITLFKMTGENPAEIVLDRKATSTDNFFFVSASSVSSKNVERRGQQKVEAKASGIIVVYNNYDTKPQKLIRNTRFQTTDGKIYRIDDPITIPGKNGTMPGSVEAKVYADTIGASYNIDLSDFTIPGFKGTDREGKFYARSKTAMTGGASGMVSVVAPQDVDAAHDDLFGGLKEEVLKTIEKQVPENYILITDTIKIEEKDNRKDLLSSSTLPFSLSVSATGYAVKENFIASKFLDQNAATANGDLIIANKKDISFIAKEEGDLFKITIQGKPVFSAYLKPEDVAKKLAGKTKNEFSGVVSLFKGIEKAEPTFSPFWIRSFPENPEKIEIEINN
jgi:hypothetical protein